MARATGQPYSFEQVVSIAPYITVWQTGDQYSHNQSLSLNGINAVDHQESSKINNILDTVSTRVTASTLITTHETTKEGTIKRGLHEMSVVVTEHPYVIRDLRISQDEPVIIGTGIRVRILVEYWRAGTPPEELLQAFPHLTLAQVFDALSYYQDHQPEINSLIEQNRVDPSLLHESPPRRS
jgi:uncharacterized protein (DUF433 family)